MSYHCKQFTVTGNVANGTAPFPLTRSGGHVVASSVTLSAVAVYLFAVMPTLYSTDTACSADTSDTPESTTISLIVALAGVALILYFVNHVSGMLLDEVCSRGGSGAESLHVAYRSCTLGGGRNGRTHEWPSRGTLKKLGN